LLELERLLIFLKSNVGFANSWEEGCGIVEALLDNTVEVARGKRPDCRLSAPRYPTVRI